MVKYVQVPVEELRALVIILNKLPYKLNVYKPLLKLVNKMGYNDVYDFLKRTSDYDYIRPD